MVEHVRIKWMVMKVNKGVLVSVVRTRSKATRMAWDTVTHGAMGRYGR